MTFVTKLTLESGDRVVLEETVAEIKSFVSGKGVQLKGPHPRPPVDYRVPLQKRLDDSAAAFPDWEYSVYRRDLEIVGRDEVARAVATRSFPRSIRVTVEVERTGTTAPGDR